mmetsp:Transcript_21252/g.59784  ORF Transcript_21252/g.59784 Transcript_21252/m.59784 type:complete len:211 (+) Transcript_21252:133-765(+)
MVHVALHLLFRLCIRACGSSAVIRSCRTVTSARTFIATVADLDDPAVGTFSLQAFSADRAAPGGILRGHVVHADQPIVVRQPPSHAGVVESRTSVYVLPADFDDRDHGPGRSPCHDICLHHGMQRPWRSNGLERMAWVENTAPRVTCCAEVEVPTTQTSIPDASEIACTATVANDSNVLGAFGAGPHPRTDGTSWQRARRKRRRWGRCAV